MYPTVPRRGRRGGSSTIASTNSTRATGRYEYDKDAEEEIERAIMSVLTNSLSHSLSHSLTLSLASSRSLTPPLSHSLHVFLIALPSPAQVDFIKNDCVFRSARVDEIRAQATSIEKVQ